MGSGIAQVAAQAGWRVQVRDLEEGAFERARGMISRSFVRFVSKGAVEQAVATAAQDRISYTTDLAEAVEGAEVVVEAVFESLDVKRGVFAELDKHAADGAVLATNTSAIPVTAIAAATDRPEQVVGTHFFSPVPMMRLCELVRGYKTSDETLQRARDFAEGVGKTCIVVNRDVAGFVTTRLIVALSVEAVRLVESGVASAEDVDVACRLGFGHAMGPLQTMDLTGVDIMVHAARNIYDETQDEKFFPPETLTRMVSAGDIGNKSGRGWYSHTE